MRATIGLTDRCNLRCVHCYVHDPVQDAQVRSRELTTTQWYGIFDQLAEAGCLWMLWTGGEILLRRDFAELYRYAKRKGFLLALFTNGTLLTKELVGFLAEWYPYVIEVSLYGLTPETYEKVTGSPAAYEQVMHGIRLLIEARVPLRLKAPAMTLTHDVLPAMYDFAAELGVPFRHDGKLWQTFHGQDISDLRLAPGDLVALDSLQAQAADDFLRLHQRFQGIKQDPAFDPGRLYTCGAGYRSFYVDPYGHLSLCQMSRPATYDLTTGAFQTGWRLLGDQREVRDRKDFACLHCDLLGGFCHRCPPFSDLENGDPETAVDHLCVLASLRAKQHGQVASPGV
jgi:MoaA/NifB/PqqE/SkfB family radical SAM enzyme